MSEANYNISATCVIGFLTYFITTSMELVDFIFIEVIIAGVRSRHSWEIGFIIWVQGNSCPFALSFAFPVERIKLSVNNIQVKKKILTRDWWVVIGYLKIHENNL